MDIELIDLTKQYSTRAGQTVLALAPTSARIASGEFVSLVGPSGCGKTTMLNLIAGLTEKSGGVLNLGSGEEVEATRPGIVFQQPVVLSWRNSIRNVMLPAELGKGKKLSRDEQTALQARARELLELVGLKGFEEKFPDELSGGMQQRLAIARALLLNSDLMLMDEPFSALDEFTRETMNVELLNIWSQRKFTTIFVTHNIFEAAFLSDRVLVMTPRPGRIVDDVVVDLPRPRSRDLIGSPEFGAVVKRIRESLEEHWTANAVGGEAE